MVLQVSEAERVAVGAFGSRCWSGSDGKESARNVEDLGSIPGWEDPLERCMMMHSCILAWRIPWIGKPGSYSPWDHKESYVTFAFA